MKEFTFKLNDSAEYISFLQKMTDIVTEIRAAKDCGLNEIFYQDEDLYLGHGEYITLIFEALDAIGCEYELDCTFIGSGIYIRWEK